MSMQRHDDVASTLMQRCINVMCPLGSIYIHFLITLSVCSDYKKDRPLNTYIRIQIVYVWQETII